MKWPLAGGELPLLAQEARFGEDLLVYHLLDLRGKILPGGLRLRRPAEMEKKHFTLYRLHLHNGRAVEKEGVILFVRAFTVLGQLLKEICRLFHRAKGPPEQGIIPQDDKVFRYALGFHNGSLGGLGIVAMG